MRKLLTIARRHPRACAAALAGVALCWVASKVVWGLSGHVLAAEAQRQALAGQSEAVAATRSDWPTHVAPVALLAEGQPGREARRVANGRIDLAISQSERGQHRALLNEGFLLLDTLSTAEGVPTTEGARWARWLAERLAIAAARLPDRQKLRLLSATDATLVTLAASAERPQPTIMEPMQPIAIESVLPPVPPEARTEKRPPQPPPLPPVEETEVVIRPVPQAPSWQPKWQELREQLSAQPEPAVPEATSVEEPKPLPVPTLSDRVLLEEFVALATRLGPEPMASGPTSSSPSKPALADDPGRQRLWAIRSELARRGFRSITASQVASLLSQEVADRLALVNRLLSTPSPNAVRLLLLLASDDSPKVRAAAISGLGSSSSRELVKTAWELAAQDNDYRVGRLAEGLRQRLR